MKARRPALIALALTGVLIMLAWQFVYRPEPAYKGKTVTMWAEQFRSNNWGGNNALAREAEVAMQQIGTNGIPFLLDLIQTRDSVLNQKLRARLPRTWHDRLSLNDRSAEIRRIGGNGFFAMGTNAPSAVAPLIKIATEAPEPDSRYVAVFALRSLRTAAEPAIPFFIQCLTNQEPTIRDEAAIALGHFPEHSEITVPALVKYLQATNLLRSYEISDAASSLVKMGTNAKVAVPTLTRLLNHPENDVRSAITNSLLRIDPEAAARVNVVRPR